MDIAIHPSNDIRAKLPAAAASSKTFPTEGSTMKNANGNGAHARGDTALVAGGAGFLGSHLCERLLDEYPTVICVDNFATGSPENVAHLMHRPGFKLIKTGVAKLTDEQAGEPRVIYNLACPASPIQYQRTPLSTLLTSVNGTNRLMQIARRSHARLLQASTSEVYGNPAVHPQTEDYWGSVNPFGPRSCYDEGKRCAETLCYIYDKYYGVSVRVARVFNTYGPRMRENDGRVVSNFIVQALRDESIKVYGDGLQTRSFCYVDDLIDGFIALMRTDGELHGPVNLGNPVEVEVVELARMIIELTGSRSRIVSRPLPVDDPPRRRPHIGRARELLGWQPRVNLEAGLRRTIEYFEARLRSEQGPVAAHAHEQRAALIAAAGDL
jgi:UDP-glucuronate decarboxylase